MRNLFSHIGRIFHKKGEESVPFKTLYAEFKKCLELNNQILDLIAEANDKLSGDYVFDEHYIRSFSSQIADMVRELIVAVNHLSRQRYTSLFESFHRIEQDIDLILEGEVISSEKASILPYREITRNMVEDVGGKNAHIADVGTHLELAIPDGFAITTTAFSSLWSYNDLERKVGDIFSELHQGNVTLEDVSQRIEKMILTAKLPPGLQEGIRDAVREVIDRGRSADVSFAVRSSALGEDDIFSFAGQFRSCLNVAPVDIPDAYRRVVASLYSREAMEYRQGKDFRPHEVMMAVACQQMIPAVTSGVMYTCDPVRPEAGTVLITSAWGLGEPIVAGRVPTDLFVVDRRPPHEVREIKIVRKEQGMVQRGSRGTEMQPLVQDQRTTPSLHNRHLEQLTGIGLQLEQYFKKPQDVEFAIDPAGKIVILQSRPLTLQQERPPRACDLTGLGSRYEIIMRGQGVAAMEGVATGPVWVLTEGKNVADFPLGAILVARYASPQLARLMQKAAGIITDVGATTGHLATVAREFRVPALLNTGEATSLLTDGGEITLDTECMTIYDGTVHELLQYNLQEESIAEMYEYRLLRRVLKKIEPLNLIDPGEENFTPEACQTYHDLTRYIHEKAVETIIDLNFYHAHHRDTRSGQLLWKYPLDLILIDVGGGISGEHAEGIRPEQIQSLPMQELMLGMSYPGMWDMAPMKVDFSSFMSSLTRTASTRYSSPEDVGRNLAVISRDYVNINFRLGYHFTVIDAFISDNILDNHIYFRFAGGVTDNVRRARRTRLLSKILSFYDFLCELQGDVIVARLKRMDKQSMLHRLFLLGLLVGFTRQLDVKMVSDERIRIYFEKIQHIMEEKE